MAAVVLPYAGKFAGEMAGRKRRPGFIRVLQLHKEYPADLLEQAIDQALSYGCVHLDGVLHCLHQLLEPKEPLPSLDLSDRPDLQNIGNQPIDISQYEKLLKYSW